LSGRHRVEIGARVVGQASALGASAPSASIVHAVMSLPWSVCVSRIQDFGRGPGCGNVRRGVGKGLGNGTEHHVSRGALGLPALPDAVVVWPANP